MRHELPHISKNHRFWDNKNPCRLVSENELKMVRGINVWYELVGGKLLGPYFS